MARCTPHPPLVFMICVRELFVRALADNHRPKGETLLSNAPYWNTDVHGRVCLGNMRVPDEVSASTIPSWEHAYFASEFTHPSGAVRLTTQAAFLDFGQLWPEGGNFPLRFLADSKQTLRGFVESTREA